MFLEIMMFRVSDFRCGLNDVNLLLMLQLAVAVETIPTDRPPGGSPDDSSGDQAVCALTAPSLSRILPSTPTEHENSSRPRSSETITANTYITDQLCTYWP